MTVYKGNYSDYSAKKEQLRAAALKAYMNQQAEIKHQEEVIAKLKSFNREKSIKRAESREKMLAKTERLEKPMVLNDSMHIEFHPAVQSGNDVMTIRGLAKSFDDLKLFEDVDIDIRRGERLAIIGDNGTGKTTLLKIINEMLSPDQGEIIFGSKVHVGYYDQEQQLLDEDKTLFDEVGDAFPQLTNTEIRNLLAAFLFTEDDVFKMIRDLSGGERGRVSLAKLMLSDANFLILDEPTNHLDIVSKEILENALNHYTGTVLFVSHDRYFINQTATRILALHDQQFVNFIGNYDYYLEKKDELFAVADRMKAQKLQARGLASGAVGGTLTGQGGAAGKGSGISSGSLAGKSAGTGQGGDSRQEWLAAKEEQARQRKRASDLKKTEDRIEELEGRNDQINELLTQEEIFTNTEKLIELNQEQKEINEELEVLYERWEDLSSEE
ncbi:MAG: ABC-F family ATP-binding cassette domain-containing protein, partial [Lachnospiraceae bacterium]